MQFGVPPGMQDCGAGGGPPWSEPMRPPELAIGFDDLELAVEVVQTEDLDVGGLVRLRGRGRCRRGQQKHE